MTVLIVLLILAFAVAPAALVAALGFRKQFDKEVFGRIYVWDKPWVLVTQDDFVKRAYEKYQRRMIWLGGVIAVSVIAVFFLVP